MQGLARGVLTRAARATSPTRLEVVALLAIGRGQPPDKVYTGRLPLNRAVFSERFGEPWPAE